MIECTRDEPKCTCAVVLCPPGWMLRWGKAQKTQDHREGSPGQPLHRARWKSDLSLLGLNVHVHKGLARR